MVSSWHWITICPMGGPWIFNTSWLSLTTTFTTAPSSSSLVKICFRSFPNRKFAINLSWKINAGLPSQVFSVLMRTGDCVLDSEPSLAADNTNGKREKSPEIEEKVPSAEARSSSSMKYCVLLSGLTTVRIHFFSFFFIFFKTLRLRRDDKIKVE